MEEFLESVVQEKDQPMVILIIIIKRVMGQGKVYFKFLCQKIQKML